MNFKKGDIIEFITVSSDGSVSTNYSYDKSLAKCRQTGAPIAQTLYLKKEDDKIINRGEVMLDTEGEHTFVQYEGLYDGKPNVNALCFNNRVIKLVKAREIMYPIF